MHSAVRLSKALGACPRIEAEGVWYRSVDGDVFLHFFDKAKPTRPLWALGAPRSGARFTPKSGPPSFYVFTDCLKPGSFVEVSSGSKLLERLP
jgi:hypothetical protein